MTAIALKPKTSRTKKRGVFSRLNIREDDVLHFLGDRKLEVVRDGKVVCRCFTDYEPEPKPLAKRSTGNDLELKPGAEKKKSYPPQPAGSYWITVSHGGEGSGTPLLVKPHEDGGATVIAGAGGAFNHLRLSKIRDPEEWKASARERSQKKREAEKQRQEELGEEGKKDEKEKIAKVKEFKQSAQAENTLETLAAFDKAGIDIGLTVEHKMALGLPPPDPGSDPEKIEKWRQLTKEATQKIKAVHQAYEQKLVTDHDARAAALLGDGDFDSSNRVIENSAHVAASPTGEPVSEIIQLPGGQWMVKGGDAPSLHDRWQDAAKDHLRNVLEAEQAMGGDRTQPDSFYSPQNWVKDVKPENLPEGFEFKPEVALEIARLSAERKAIDKAALEGEDAVKKRSPLEMGKGFDMPTVQKITQQEVIDKLESEAKTLKDAFVNNAFLEHIENHGDAEKMKKHHQIGGYSMVAELSSEVFKQNPISRQLVDLLGHSEGAKVLAYMMKANMTSHEYEVTKGAIAAWHGKHSTDFARGATKQTGKYMERLKSLHEEMIVLNEFAEGDLSPTQQIQMDSLMYEAKSLEDSIQQVLGITLGRLQASAATVAALEASPKTLRFSGEGAKAIAKQIPGQTELDDDGNPKPSIFAAYGLTEDDFKRFDGPDGEQIQINESGLQKLAVGYNPEDKEAYERAVAIKRGDFDEVGFVPEGFSYYAKASFTSALDNAQQFDTKFDLLGKLAAKDGAGEGTLSLFGDADSAAESMDNDDPGAKEGDRKTIGDAEYELKDGRWHKVSTEISDQDVEDGLRSYIGARVANGENPLDVMGDVRSPEFYMQQGLDPYGESALRVQNTAAELVKKAAGGDNIADKAVISAFQEMGDAEAGKQRRARQTDDLQTLHAQTLDDDASVEAAHRTLAAMPMARTVFKGWGDLSAKEKQFVKDYAITEILGQQLDPPKEKKTSESATESAVAEEQFDLFGNKISAAEALGQTDEDKSLSQWEQFSKLMGGQDKAIAATRDHLRGKFMHRFANAYSSISGTSPLIGGEGIANVDRLLLAKMPEDQRNQMLEFMKVRKASEVASVRARSGGKFASEMDDEWMDKYESIKGNNRQISLLAADTGRSAAKTDFQRTTIGKAAETQLHEVMQKVLPNFEQINSDVAIIPEVNWSAGTQHATKQRALKFLEAQKKVGIHFGAGCVHGSTLLRCEKTGLEQSFQDWWLSGQTPWVRSLDESTGKTVIAQASPVFVKAYDEMFQVTLESGDQIIVTAGHRFLGRDGWAKLGLMSVGDEVAIATPSCSDDRSLEVLLSLQDSSSEPCPSIRALDVQHWKRKLPSSSGHYSACSRQCDEQLHQQSGDDLEPSPLPIGVPSHSPLTFPHPNKDASNPLVIPLESAPDLFRGDSQPCDGGHCCASKAFLPPLGGHLSQQLFEPLKNLSRNKDTSHSPDQASSWSKITYIKEVGMHFVFDITVPKYHNYEAHGIFNHNSGKSAIMLGCFSHLHAQGKIKKSLIAVPSSIVGQFSGEAATFLKAGTYNYKANLGMSQEERIACYKDPDLHVFVTTRESLSNDLLHLVEKHQGVDPETYRTKSEDEQKSLMLNACKAEGINPEELLLSIDEAHDVTARGKVDPSKRSLSLNALGHHASYYVQATGNAVRNDLTEAYNFLHTMAPDKFNDMSKFMSEYAGNTGASRRSLQRVMAPYSFAASTKPQDKSGRTLKMNEYQPVIPANDKIAAARQSIIDDTKVISEWQTGHREKLKEQHGANYQPSTEDFNAAWDDPKVRDAVNRLGSDNTWHSLDDKGKQGAIGGQVRALGGLKKQALFRLYHLTSIEDNPKMQWTVDHAIKKFKDEGKPGIVFSGSSVAAEQMVKEFEKRGMRVAYIHGGLDSNGKDRERLKFQSDKPEADILIATDAARTGLNLTRGKVLYHYDVPTTEMSYGQRSARIHRLKQNSSTEIFTPLLDAPEEKMAWARVQRKGAITKPLTSRSERIDDVGLSRKIREARATKAA